MPYQDSTTRSCPTKDLYLRLKRIFDNAQNNKDVKKGSKVLNSLKIKVKMLIKDLEENKRKKKKGRRKKKKL